MPGARRLALACVLLGASCQWGARRPRQKGRVTSGSFESAALGVRKRYVVWLPAGYEGEKARYPVITLLHGLGGNEDDWTRAGHLAEAADRLGLRAIVVMPDGDDGFYLNAVSAVPYEDCLRRPRPFGPEADLATYCVRRPLYEDYIVRDLRAEVDGAFRTVADRRGRALAGLSMGGFGALLLALRHRDLYGAAASHSGLCALLYGGPHPYVAGRAQLIDDPARWGETVRGFAGHVRALLGPDLANWRAHDPAWLARSLGDGELALYLDCGREDEFAFDDGARYLHDLLEQAHVRHRFAIVPGHHDFDLWRERIGESLRFFAEHFARAGL